MVKLRASTAILNNHLLTLLPDSEFQNLHPYLEHIELPFKKALFRCRAPIDTVYFPTAGVVSAVTYLKNSLPVEVATVGNEGMVGALALLGEVTSPNETFVQVNGDGWRMSAKDLRRLAPPGSVLNQVIVKYLNAFAVQVSQSVACNAIHTVQPRCCRWLLMTQDRVMSADLRLTHEFLSVMLGVRRASISEVLAPLQKAGLISSSRGTIKILDRQGVEKKSCECYGVVKDEYRRLLGDPATV